MDRVAISKEREALAEQIQREAQIEDRIWAASLILVFILAAIVWAFKTIIPGGPAAIPFYVFLLLVTAGMTFGVWRINR